MNPYPQLLRALATATVLPAGVIAAHVAAGQLTGTPHTVATASAAMLGVASILTRQTAQPRPATPADSALIPVYVAFPVIATSYVTQVLAVSLWADNSVMTAVLVVSLVVQRALQHRRAARSVRPLATEAGQA